MPAWHWSGSRWSQSPVVIQESFSIWCAAFATHRLAVGGARRRHKNSFDDSGLRANRLVRQQWRAWIETGVRCCRDGGHRWLVHQQWRARIETNIAPRSHPDAAGSSASKGRHGSKRPSPQPHRQHHSNKRLPHCRRGPGQAAAGAGMAGAAMTGACGAGLEPDKGGAGCPAPPTLPLETTARSPQSRSDSASRPPLQAQGAPSVVGGWAGAVP